MSEQDSAARFRFRARYVKHGRLAYLGHLELAHTIERVVRRAALPYVVTQGFSPHMRVGFTSALPVGTASDAEYFDVWLTDYVPADEALRRLSAAAPADMAPVELSYLDLRAPALTAEITRALYRVELTPARSDVDAASVFAALKQVIGQGSIPYVRGRKQKELDLATTLVSTDCSPADEGRIALNLDTRVSNEGSLRPEILIAALDRALCPAHEFEGPIVSSGIQDLYAFRRYSVCRTAQYVEDADGSLLSPLRAGETTSAPISVSSVPSL